MATNFLPNSPGNFCCIQCDYNTSRKNQYDKHLLTSKHEKTTKRLQQTTKNLPEFICDVCNKTYIHHSSLWKHKKKCVVNESQIQPLEINALTNLVLDLVKSNQELQKQNQDFQQQMLEVYKNGIMNNTNNNIANISN